MSIQLWKQHLRYDPTRWLLETDDPSILLWVQLDIANRPPDAPGVLDTRDRVLYSDPVQKLFTAQNEIGYWGNPESLAQPYYTATLWNLALLAERGIPPTSRRARNGCEYILQNFQNDNGTIANLTPIETSYLLHALAYFNYASDPRTLNAARALANQSPTPETAPAVLWGLHPFRSDPTCSTAAQRILEFLLANLPPPSSRYTFPQFNPLDPLFLLRVLTGYDQLRDPRVVPHVQTLIQSQTDRAQWTLAQTLPTLHHPPLEPTGQPSRWVTLNALRVLVRAVLQSLP